MDTASKRGDAQGTPGVPGLSVERKLAPVVSLPLPPSKDREWVESKFAERPAYDVYKPIIQIQEKLVVNRQELCALLGQIVCPKANILELDVSKKKMPPLTHMKKLQKHFIKNAAAVARYESLPPKDKEKRKPPERLNPKDPVTVLTQALIIHHRSYVADKHRGFDGLRIQRRCSYRGNDTCIIGQPDEQAFLRIKHYGAELDENAPTRPAVTELERYMGFKKKLYAKIGKMCLEQMVDVLHLPDYESVEDICESSSELHKDAQPIRVPFA